MKTFLVLILICCWHLQLARSVPATTHVCVGCEPECSGTWTSFYDRDDPSGTGDWEDLANLRRENAGAICRDPLAVYAETVDGVSASETGENFESYDTEDGFICRNTDQSDGSCRDYKVKFCCRDCNGWITKFYDGDNPDGTGDYEDLSSLRHDYSEICSAPSAIYAETLDGTPAESTGEVFEYYDTARGFVCKKDSQSDGQCQDYRVRFCCPGTVCSHGRIGWYDVDDPTYSGDWERITDAINAGFVTIDNICHNRAAMQVRKVGGTELVTPDDGDFHTFDTVGGFVCMNHEHQLCDDYEVRMCCMDYAK
ncbi:mucin-5AC-like [Ptychodera flava]|uniref:mucin-5AC-like n=1 Tax=Ptychodera flava TaxID=63121 RepID=UPI00396A615B